MKVYNKKGLIWGIIWLLLGMSSMVISMIKPDDFLPGRIKDALVAGLLLIIGGVSIFRAFSKKASDEDKLEEKDERNCLIEVKSKARTLDIMFWAILILILIGIIGYTITRDLGWAMVILLPAILISIYFITYLVTTLYYEKHE